MNKAFYKRQAEKHFKLYEKALSEGDQGKANHHMTEYLNYEKASK